MNQLAITNIKQGKLLVDAGLKYTTADFYLNVNTIKDDFGALEIRETPYLIQRDEDWNAIRESKYYVAAWSLGKLISMLPESIPSVYDEGGNEIENEDDTTFFLQMDRNNVKYINKDGTSRLSANGSCLINAVVEMIIKLLDESYDLILDE